jgi:hypothetical protein
VTDIHLTIKSTGQYGSRGEFYEVVHDGEIIVRSVDPECCACRVLEARGISGFAHFWRDGQSTWSTRMSTIWGASHRVRESATQGLAFVRWTEFPTELLRDTETEEVEETDETEEVEKTNETDEPDPVLTETPRIPAPDPHARRKADERERMQFRRSADG